MSEDEVVVIETLGSNHEEADTKLIALVKAANVSVGDSVMIRSPSGDIDVLVLFLGHDFADIQILIDNGTGLSRKIIDITSSTREEHSSVCTPFLEMTALQVFSEKGK